MFAFGTLKWASIQGRLAFFDLAKHAEAIVLPNALKWEDGTFYGSCCNLTCETKGHFGVIPFGVVSSSGFGDGGYPCFVKRNEEGQIVAAIIPFIEEWKDEDE